VEEKKVGQESRSRMVVRFYLCLPRKGAEREMVRKWFEKGSRLAFQPLSYRPSDDVDAVSTFSTRPVMGRFGRSHFTCRKCSPRPRWGKEESHGGALDGLHTSLLIHQRGRFELFARAIVESDCFGMKADGEKCSKRTQRMEGGIVEVEMSERSHFDNHFASVSPSANFRGSTNQESTSA